MPRNKATPVKRGVNRFHDSVVDVPIVQEVSDEETEESDAGEVVDASSDENERIPNSNVSSNVDRSKKKLFSCEIQAVDAGWVVVGRKSMPKCCNFGRSTSKLHLFEGGMVMLTCSACSASLYIDTLGTQLGKHAAQLVHADTVRFSVEHTRLDSATTATHLSACIRSSCTFLPPLFLHWALSFCDDQSGRIECVEQKFSATEFLQAVAAHKESRAQAMRIDADLVRAAGISTTLRYYQLQGVDWMFRKIDESRADAATMNSGLDQALQGWWRLPSPSATPSSVSSSSSRPVSDSAVQDIWYNSLTEELKVCAGPPASRGVSADHPEPISSAKTEVTEGTGGTPTRLGRGLILADEMGVGKSLQIIALVALLKHARQQRADASAATPLDRISADGADPCEGKLQVLRAATSEELVEVLPQETLCNDAAEPALTAVSSRPCLCGSAEDLRRRDLRALGWIQCSSCGTWLHAPCAGFHRAEDASACDVFVCLACSCLQKYFAPVASHAALIVMPNTLINQWKAELLKHTAGVTFNNPTAPVGLKVFIYPDGLGSEQGCDYGRVDPRHLALYDIVLMSFRALQKGYHESNVDYASARIQRSSYAVYPPPFLCVRYGLLVVDETQNIETQSTSQILTMACRIPSVHRISVSGTPLGSGRLSDLYSLCRFLRAAPLCDRRTWLRLIEKPAASIPVCERIQLLQEFFADFTLRRTKNLIHEQLGLPQHVVLTRPLHFSTFERALYDEKLAEYCNALLNAQYSDAGGRLDIADAKAKLELLRKGCCHPQVLDRALGGGTGSGARKGAKAAQGKTAEVSGPRPLDEIMVVKVEQSRLQCEELQRTLLFHLFSTAGATALQAQACVLGIGHAAAAANVESSDSQGGDACAYLVKAHAIYRLALSLVDAHRSHTPLIAMVRLGGPDNLSTRRCGSSQVIPAALLGVVVPHAVSGICLHWDVSATLRSAGASTAATFADGIDWSPLTSSAVDTPPCSSSTQERPHEDKPGDLWARLTFSSGRRILGVNADSHSGVEGWLQRVREHYDRSLSSSSSSSGASSFSAMTAQYVYYIELRPSAVDLQVGLGSTDTYLTECSVACEEGHGALRADEDSSGERVRAATRSKRWQVKVSSVQSQCLVVRCRVLAGSVLVSNAECAWVPTAQLGTLYQTLLRTPGTVAVEVGVGVRVQLQEAMYDTDALQELHACHNLRSLPGLLPDEASVARFVEQVRYRRLSVSTVAQPGQLSTVLKTLDTDSPLSTPCEIVAAEDSVPSKDCGLDVADRAARIERDFLEAATGRRIAADCDLREALQRTDEKSDEICALLTAPTSALAAAASRGASVRRAERTWWNELLDNLDGDVRFSCALQGCIQQGESAYRKLENFSSTRGLQYLLGKEFDETESARAAARKMLAGLSKVPSPAEIAESTECQSCRAYFGKTGPVCGHCKNQEYLREYSAHVLCYRRQNKRVVANGGGYSATSHPKKKARAQSGAGKVLGSSAIGFDEERVEGELEDFEVRTFDEGAVDGMLLMVLKQLRAHAGSFAFAPASDGEHGGEVTADGRAAPRPVTTFREVCVLEIKRQEGLKAEVAAMMAAWDRYSELLKAHDELAQCKTRVSLIVDTATAPITFAGAIGGSKGSKKGRNTASQQPSSGREAQGLAAAQLHRYELAPSIAQSVALAVQADAELKKATANMGFYKAQVKEIFLEATQAEGDQRVLDDVAEEPSLEGCRHTASSSSSASLLPAESYQEVEATITAASQDSAAVVTAVRSTGANCMVCMERLFLPALQSPTRAPSVHAAAAQVTPVPAQQTAAPVQEEPVVVLPCAHRYHAECVAGWVKKHRSCPLCKARVTPAELILVGPAGAQPARSHQHDNVAISITAGPSCSASTTAEVPQSSSSSSSTLQALTPLDAGMGDDEDSEKAIARSPGDQQHPARAKLIGKWGTKVDQLVQDLLKLTADPDRLEEKAIVFSQWVEMVDIVGEALRANKIAFVKCTNRGKDFASTGALEGFRANSSLRVLLMPLGLGAEGLDLIVASHVYLLEPLLNVHQEMQAVNRISRLGQARRTYVHKYVLQGTIEERITQVQRGESESKEKNAQGGGHYRPQQQRAKMHRDDDLLDEADLRFILNLPAAPLLGRDADHHGAGSANGGAAQDSAAEDMLIGTC